MKLKNNSLLLTTSIFMLLNSLLVQAQTACFSIDNNKGCTPFTVNITDCSSGGIGGNDIGYKYEGTEAGYDNSAAVIKGGITQHIYLNPSPVGTPFILKQKLATGGADPTFQRNVTVITPVLPPITVKLCSSRQVVLNINDNTYDTYTIDWGDGNSESVLGNSNTTHPYPDLNPRTITVTGVFGTSSCAGSVTSIPVTPIATIPTPDITHLEITNESLNGTLEVGFNADPNPTYRYDLMTGTTTYPDPIPPQNLTGDPRFSIAGGIIKLTNVNTLNEYQCLKIRALDACSGAAVAQNEICTVRTFDVQAQNLQNQLTWDNYPDGSTFSSFDIIRDGVPFSSGAFSPRIDNNVVCATNYCYRVKTNLNKSSSAGPVYSLSANKCVTAISTTVPPAVTNVNSTINGSNTQVKFDAPPAGTIVKKYYIFEASGNTASTGTSTNPSFAGNPGTCYRIAYDDNCNNRSIVSPFTCTVNLTGTLADDGSIALNWTAYSGYLNTGIASYDVLLLNENGGILKTIPAGLGLSASDILDANAGSLYYKIRVNSGGSENLVSYSNLIEISLSPTIFIPNAFTPNGDGTNDIFIAKSRFVKSLEMTVFNRWGEPVFKTTDMNIGWDGKVNGTDAPVGSYAYTITLEGGKGESSTERGTISLIR